MTDEELRAINSAICLGAVFFIPVGSRVRYSYNLGLGMRAVAHLNDVAEGVIRAFEHGVSPLCDGIYRNKGLRYSITGTGLLIRAAGILRVLSVPDDAPPFVRWPQFDLEDWRQL
jgi:hypothetical protein